MNDFETTNMLTREMVVIGNGYDLECGLKTRYKDFSLIDIILI